MTGDTELKQKAKKPLGKYLVEAGIITLAQLEIALYEQHKSKKRIGEILSERAWVKQETVEYFLKKIILPEREATQTKIFNRDFYRLLPESSSDLALYLSPRKVTQFLLLLSCILMAACVLIEVGTYIVPGYPLQSTLISLFNIDGDQSVPGIFSSALLLFCFFLLGAIAYSQKISENPYTPQWIALAIIFFYLSVDEAIGIHERIGLVITGKFYPSGIFYYAWTIPEGIFVMICLLTFWRFINHLPQQTKFLFLLAGSTYIGGAFIVEMYNGYYMSRYGYQLTYYPLTAVEESMEMLGIILFIYSLLTHISSYMKGLQLRVTISGQKVKS